MKNVTQASVGQSQAADMKTMLDQVGLSFVDILFGGFGNVLSAIGSAINKFISDLLIGLRGATGGLIDLTGFIKQTDTKATEAIDKATLADAAAGNAAIVAADADAKAVQANNAAAAAAELAAQAAGGQDASNMAYVYNSEKETMRTQYPAATPYSYVQDNTLAVSGEWLVALAPSALAAPTMPLGPAATVTAGEKIYMEWRQRRNSANYTARLNLEIRDNGNNVIAADLSPVQPTSAIANGQWITYAGIVTIPTNGTKATPQLKSQQAANTAEIAGQWYFEEMVVRRAITTGQIATPDGVPLDTKLVSLAENNTVTNALAVSAANQAQEALVTADIAYENAQYWKDECVVSSAEVLLGRNELLIGVVMDVPTGRTRKITDMHFAFYQKPGSMVVETRAVTPAGVDRLLVSHSIPSTVTRFNVNNLDINVFDKERVYWEVKSSSAVANVMQIALVGVLL